MVNADQASNAILGYASYLPGWRVDPVGRDREGRLVASFDEDAVTMGVAAARSLPADLRAGVGTLTLVTSSPPYLDKTNAGILHAALALDRTVAVHDAIGTARSTMAGLRTPSPAGSALLVAADVRVGRPGSADERAGSDAAAAVVLGSPGEHHPALAEIIGTSSLTEEFLDRWRDPAEAFAASWEERFGFECYAPLIREGAAAALAAAGLTAVDRVILTSPNPAVGKRARALLPESGPTTGSPVGFCGAADPLLALIDVLDAAGPDETILLISAADGVDAVVLRTTAALSGQRQRIPLSAQRDGGRQVPYTTYLSWRGLLDVEPPRRPEPDRPAAPPAARSAGWKYGLHGSGCADCGFVHLPPMRVCRRCGSSEPMAAVPVSTRTGRIATFTVDRLAYSPSPPVVDVVVDFDGGGRTTFEVADADAESLAVGAPVEMAFRRLFSAGGVHNYFWKARQIVDTVGEERS